MERWWERNSWGSEKAGTQVLNNKEWAILDGRTFEKFRKRATGTFEDGMEDWGWKIEGCDYNLYKEQLESQIWVARWLALSHPNKRQEIYL